MAAPGEIVAYLSLGIFCGLLGASFVHATASLVQLIRQLRVSVEASNSAAKARASAGERRCITVEGVLSLLLSR